MNSADTKTSAALPSAKMRFDVLDALLGVCAVIVVLYHFKSTGYISNLMLVRITSDDLHITFQGGFLRCVFGFATGVLTYHAFRRFGGIGGSVWELALLIITVTYVCFAEDALTFIAPFVFSAMIFVLASQRGVVSRVLSMRVFQMLGLFSYSIYMIHNFQHGRFSEVLQIAGAVEVSVNDDGVTTIIASPLVSDGLTIIMVLLLVFASFVSYHLVEKPGQVITRRLLNKPSANLGQAA